MGGTVGGVLTVGPGTVRAGMADAGAVDCGAAAFGVFGGFEVTDFDGFFRCHVLSF